MTSWLIGSGPSDHLSSPVRAKVEWCKSSDLFSCWVKDCESHPWALWVATQGQQVASLGGGYPSAEVQSVDSTAPANREDK